MTYLVKEKPSSHAPAKRQFDLAITLCVIGILATLLLHRLNDAQVEIEKVMLATEVNNLRLSLAEAWVHKSVTNQPINVASLQNSNPMLLIAEPPFNYIGELTQKPTSAEAIWYFDTKRKQLIYVFKDGHQARFKLSSTFGNTKTSLLGIGGLDLVPD